MSDLTYTGSGARSTDPVSSHLAAIDSPGRVSQRQLMLLAYGVTREYLTDEQASVKAGVSPRSCWWKRCSELRQMGYIEPLTDEHLNPVLVTGSQGKLVLNCFITPRGVQYLRSEGLLGPSQ